MIDVFGSGDARKLLTELERKDLTLTQIAPILERLDEEDIDKLGRKNSNIKRARIFSYALKGNHEKILPFIYDRARIVHTFAWKLYCSIAPVEKIKEMLFMDDGVNARCYDAFSALSVRKLYGELLSIYSSTIVYNVNYSAAYDMFLVESLPNFHEFKKLIAAIESEKLKFGFRGYKDYSRGSSATICRNMIARLAILPTSVEEHTYLLKLFLKYGCNNPTSSLYNSSIKYFVHYDPKLFINICKQTVANYHAKGATLQNVNFLYGMMKHLVAIDPLTAFALTEEFLGGPVMESAAIRHSDVNYRYMFQKLLKDFYLV